MDVHFNGYGPEQFGQNGRCNIREAMVGPSVVLPHCGWPGQMSNISHPHQITIVEMTYLTRRCQKYTRTYRSSGLHG